MVSAMLCTLTARNPRVIQKVADDLASNIALIELCFEVSEATELGILDILLNGYHGCLLQRPSVPSSVTAKSLSET